MYLPALALSASLASPFDAMYRLQPPGHYYIYHLDINPSGRVQGAIAVFARNAKGNVAPERIIEGKDTQINLGNPRDIALDEYGYVYVLQDTCFPASAAIDVFAPGASGDTPPVRVICGPTAQLRAVTGATVDPMGDVYVTQLAGSRSEPAEVLIYAAGTNGDVPPTAVIAGPATQLARPFRVALDGNLNVYVLNQGASGSYETILEYPAGATGNVAPIASFILAHEPYTIRINGQTLYTVWGAHHNQNSFVDAYTVPSFQQVAHLQNRRRFAALYDVAPDSTGELYLENATRPNFSVLDLPPGSADPTGSVRGNLTTLNEGKEQWAPIALGQ